MNSRTRRLALLTTATALALGGLGIQTASVAGSVAPRDPGTAGAWPWCHTAPDTDGECIVSLSVDGRNVAAPTAGTPGTTALTVAIENLRGAWQVALKQQTFLAGGASSVTDDVPDGTYSVVLNMGTFDATTVHGTGEEVVLDNQDSQGDHVVTLTARPTEIGWRDTDEDGSPFPCSHRGCGDDTTRATLEERRLSLVLSDPVGAYGDAGETWVGQKATTNIQHARYWGAAGIHRLFLANPHLRADGATSATGHVFLHLPYAYLRNVMEVARPEDLARAEVDVARKGSALAVPFDFAHSGNGIDVALTGITFSTPTYTLKVRPRGSRSEGVYLRPGAPRLRDVARIDHTSTRVRFRGPRSIGGAPVLTYRARCKVGRGPWRTASAQSSPVVVRRLTPGRLTCQVQARNRAGWSVWSDHRA